MNPFSAFLQPRSAPLQVPDTFGALNQASMQRKELAERARQADANNAIQQGYLGVQQGQLGLQKEKQARQFADQERNEVEGLIQEYQEAVAKGEPQVIQDVLQKLKRFGMEVKQGQAPEPAQPKPISSISPFTGMPFLPHSPFQATQANVGDGLSSNARAEDPNDDRLMGQDEFENKLIGDSSAAPESMESGGSTTQEGKDYIQRTTGQSPGMDPGDEGRNGGVMDLDTDPGDAGRNGNVMDLDEPEPAQATPQPAQRIGPTGLPVIISRGGKQLYESGNQGRWQPLVSSVFEPYLNQSNPEIAQAAKNAQSLAGKLVGVDGIPPKDAIKFAMDRFEQDATRITDLERTRLGSKPRGGGGLLPGGILGKTDDSLNDDLDKVRTMWVNSAGYKKMEEQAGQMDDAEAGLMSPDGVAQNNALATLRRIQSGLTLNASEMRDFNGAAGALENIKKQFSRYLGQGQLPEEYRRQVQAVMAQMRNTVRQRMERGAQEAYDYWMQSRKRRASPEIIGEKGDALKRSLSGGADPNADLYD